MVPEPTSESTGGVTAGEQRPVLTRLERPTGPGAEGIIRWGLLMLLMGAAFWGRSYWMPDAWRFPRRESAPDGLSWLPFETTRQGVLERLARNGAQSTNIEPPRMGPMVWASHVNLTLEGRPIKEFALIYSDEAQYNFRALGRGGAKPLDAAALATPGSDTARVVAIRWQPSRSFVDENSQAVPADVLGELGIPHEEGKNPQGSGKIYRWNWTGVTARYETVSNQLILDRRPPRDDSDSGAK